MSHSTNIAVVLSVVGKTNIAAVLSVVGKTNLDAIIQKLGDLFMCRPGERATPLESLNYFPNLLFRKAHRYSNGAALDSITTFSKPQAFWKAINASHSQALHLCYYNTLRLFNKEGVS